MSEEVYEQTAYYRDRLYKYISSLSTPNQTAKQHYSDVAQCHFEQNKKVDGSNYCSTCHTTNAYQWRLKLKSPKIVPKHMKQAKNPKKKFNELVVKCVVCHATERNYTKKRKTSS